MKRLLAFALTAVLLCGCAPTVPAGTTAPPAQTTLPTGTTAPAETTLPIEATAPPVFPTEVPDTHYTVNITDPEQSIYAEPSFLSEWAAYFGEAGTYTIVEEATDRDGNLWGKLKSGIGWTCLTDPAKAPIYAAYAEEDFRPTQAYWTEETEYVTKMAFTTDQTLREVQFTLLTWDETYEVDSVLYEFDTLDADNPFLAAVVFWGDMTTYGISFRDEGGSLRRFALTISGKDGSLLCFEY